MRYNKDTKNYKVGWKMFNMSGFVHWYGNIYYREIFLQIRKYTTEFHLPKDRPMTSSVWSC